MIKTVLFDFDGTVADTLPIIFETIRATFSRFLLEHYENEDIIRLFGPPETAILQNKIPLHQHAEALDCHARIDHSDADIAAAKAAKVIAVGVNWLSVSQKTGGFDPKPDFFFTDPADFTAWVLNWSV